MANSRVFTISGSNVEISGVKMRHGNTSGDKSGGGITNFGGLTLTDSIVTDNRATFNGGGLVIVGGGILNQGKLTLDNTAVTSNSSSVIASAGGTFISGGGIVNRFGTSPPLFVKKSGLFRHSCWSVRGSRFIFLCLKKSYGASPGIISGHGSPQDSSPYLRSS